MQPETLVDEAVSAEEPIQVQVIDVPTVLLRKRQSIVAVTVAAALVSLSVALFWPARYTAVTKILAPQQNQSLAAAMVSQLGALGSMASMAQKDLGIRNPNDMYVGMLRSRTIEDALIQKFGLLKVYRERRMSDARKELEKVSEITTGKEGFITIAVEDKDPKRAADIANAYVEQLRKISQNFSISEAGQRRLFFDQQLEEAKTALANSEEALKKTQQETGLIQLDSQAKAIIESVVKLRAEIAMREVQLRGMRSFATEANPDLVLIEQQLAALRSQLAIMTKQGGGDGDFQVATGKMPQAGLEYVRKLRDFKYHEAIFELLAKQAEAARLDEARAGGIIQVLDPAVEPDIKSSPKRGLIFFGGTIFGFLAAAGYQLWREVLNAKAASNKLLSEQPLQG